MVSWSAGMRPSTACATTPASRPRQRSSTNERALVAAGHSGVISVPFGREHHVEDLADAFVDVDLRGALRRVGEVAQDRRDPFDQERAVGVVGRPVDRAGRLRIGAVEVERDVPVLLDHLERELVQLRVGDAVVLDVVLPGVFAVGDLRQQLVAIDVAALVEDGLEAGLDRSRARTARTAVPCRRAPITQAWTSLSRSAASISGTRVLRLTMVNTASLRTPSLVELDRRDREAFLEHGDGRARHRARHAAADVVMMAESLDVGDDLAVMEHRHGAAKIGQVADAAFGEISVVHQKHVARPHGLAAGSRAPPRSASPNRIGR